MKLSRSPNSIDTETLDRLIFNESVVEQLEALLKDEKGASSVELRAAKQFGKSLATLVKSLRKNPTKIEASVLNRLEEAALKLNNLLSGITQERTSIRQKIVNSTSQDPAGTYKKKLEEKNLEDVTVPQNILVNIDLIIKGLKAANREVYAQATQSLTPTLARPQTDQILNESPLPEGLESSVQDIVQNYEQQGAVLVPSKEDTGILSKTGPSISLRYNKHPVSPQDLKILLRNPSSAPYLERIAKMPGGARVIAITPHSILLGQKDEGLVAVRMVQGQATLIVTPEERKLFDQMQAANEDQIRAAVQASGYTLASKDLTEISGATKGPSAKKTDQSTEKQVFAAEMAGAQPIARQTNRFNWKKDMQEETNLRNLGVKLLVEIPLN